MNVPFRACLLMLALVVAACSVPQVPDQTYYHLPRPAELPKAAAPLFERPVVVELFGADGLYADRALVYALDADARELRQYHYQLWTDPPTRLLQRRLIVELRQAGVAPRVTDALPASMPALRIAGVILRFERVPAADGGARAVVVLKLRASGADGVPLVEEIYRAEAPVDGKRLVASADAFGRAIDQAFAAFHADLLRIAETDHVR